MTVTSPPELSYAPRPPWHRKRRVRRYVMLFALTVTALLIWHWRKPLHARGRLWLSQRACLNYTAPPDTIAYIETDVQSLGRLITSEPGYVLEAGESFSRPRCAARMVPEWDRLQELAWGPRPMSAGGLFGGGGGPPPPPPPKSSRVIDALPYHEQHAVIVFLHERRSAAGHSRLVVVELAQGQSKGCEYWLLVSTAHEYGALGSVNETVRSQVLQVNCFAGPDSHDLANPCCFFGQHDAADRSHFTIEYELDGKLGTIDGRLLDDDQVRLTVRDGPASGPGMSLVPTNDDALP